MGETNDTNPNLESVIQDYLLRRAKLSVLPREVPIATLEATEPSEWDLPTCVGIKVLRAWGER